MEEIPESLVRLVQALVDDPALREWFESLAIYSERERAAEFRAVATHVGSAGKHIELSHATALLAAPGMYEAVRASVAELAGNQ